MAETGRAVETTRLRRNPLCALVSDLDLVQEHDLGATSLVALVNFGEPDLEPAFRTEVHGLPSELVPVVLGWPLAGRVDAAGELERAGLASAHVACVVGALVHAGCLVKEV